MLEYCWLCSCYCCSMDVSSISFTLKEEHKKVNSLEELESNSPSKLTLPISSK